VAAEVAVAHRQASEQNDAAVVVVDLRMLYATLNPVYLAQEFLAPLTKMQVMARRHELEVASGCRDGEAIQRGLAHLTLDGGAAGGGGDHHDDLAIALSIACWRAKIR
jgi:hypothetical protein